MLPIFQNAMWRKVEEKTHFVTCSPIPLEKLMQQVFRVGGGGGGCKGWNHIHKILGFVHTCLVKTSEKASSVDKKLQTIVKNQTTSICISSFCMGLLGVMQKDIWCCKVLVHECKTLVQQFTQPNLKTLIGNTISILFFFATFFLKLWFTEEKRRENPPNNSRLLF